MGQILYRAVHTRAPWRKVSSHKTLESALNGPNGGRSLFERRNRIDYDKLGDPIYCFVWRSGDVVGYAMRKDDSSWIEVPVAELEALERVEGENMELITGFFPG